MRRTGIDVIGDAPWGTHFCQFYSTKDDLADVLVPYFKRGLEDEFCMGDLAAPRRRRGMDALAAKAVPKPNRTADVGASRSSRTPIGTCSEGASSRTGCSRDG